MSPNFTYSYYRPDGNGLGILIVMQDEEEIWHLTERTEVGLDSSPSKYPAREAPDKHFRVEEVSEQGVLVSPIDSGPLDSNEAAPAIPVFPRGARVTVFWGPIRGETVSRHDFEVVNGTPEGGLLLRPPGVTSIQRD